ncbi:HAD-like domain-containing protein [Coemansia spiralis]|nr:HAD-like domain-containing protein [Coemansia spiralis]
MAETKQTQLSACGLLFDLDGTLISTLQVTEAIYTRCALEHNIDPAPVLAFCHGVPTLHVLRQFFPPSTHTVEYAQELEMEATLKLDGLRVISGAKELLSAIPEDGWAIYTSGMPFLAVPRMKHLGIPMPKVLVTPQDVVNGKPSPDGYVLAARKLGLEATQCVVFEDAKAGARAGKESGAVVVGIRTLLSDSELKQAGADYTVRDMTKVQVSVNGDGSLAVAIDES